VGIIIDRIMNVLKTDPDTIVDTICDKLSNMYKEFYFDMDIDTGIPIAPPKLLTNGFNIPKIP